LPSPQDQIIAAFDECLEYVFGRQYGRDNPHSSDMQTADSWLASGLTLPVACFVFYRQMNLMHERWLRDDLHDRSHIPHSLKVFDENIEVAIRRAQDGEMSTCDVGESQWRARLKGWKRNSGLWNENQWGPPPNVTGCRAPRSLVGEECRGG
jgi:hypothetical protein